MTNWNDGFVLRFVLVSTEHQKWKSNYTSVGCRRGSVQRSVCDLSTKLLLWESSYTPVLTAVNKWTFQPMKMFDF
jgi:hypothetical protein